MARVGCVQLAPRLGDKGANLATIEQMVGGAPARLLVLPELCLTGYSLPSRSAVLGLAEPVPEGPSVRRLQALASSSGTSLVVGLAELEGDRVFNSAVLLRPDGSFARYRKIHLFEREKELFDPGDGPLEAHRLGEIMVGIMICFDWAFPEVARTLALAGADLVAHPSCLVLPHGQQAMVVRCLENGIFALTCNRIGSETAADGREVVFTGESQIAGPRATVLGKASRDRAQTIVADIDPGQARDKSLGRGNDLLADRRPSLYRL